MGNRFQIPINGLTTYYAQQDIVYMNGGTPSGGVLEALMLPSQSQPTSKRKASDDANPLTLAAKRAKKDVR